MMNVARTTSFMNLLALYAIFAVGCATSQLLHNPSIFNPARYLFTAQLGRRLILLKKH